MCLNQVDHKTCKKAVFLPFFGVGRSCVKPGRSCV